MKKLHFTIAIDAPRAVVWKALLEPESFKVWTAAFAPGSYFEGSWEQGAAIRFLTPEGEGMVSRIAANRPHAFISIEHLGFIKDGVEDTASPEIKAWAPAYENYTLREKDGVTEFQVDMDVLPDFEEFMNRAWPEALERLKTICEK
jgi:hypothetical protein